MTKSLSIFSIGQAAALIQKMPAAICAAAQELKIEPAMRINNIAHFSEADLQRISELLHKQPDSIMQHHARDLRY